MSDRVADPSIERATLVRAQARDPVAFESLVQLYERRVFYYVRRLLGSQVDTADVLQEIWLKVFLRLPSLQAPEAFCVWLYKIAHDISITQLRKHLRSDAMELDEEFVSEECASDGWNELELLEHSEQLHGALSRLSLPHREVLTLRFLEGLELAEIADIVGCNLGTVKSRLHYAKAEIRKLLETTCDGS